MLEIVEHVENIYENVSLPHVRRCAVVIMTKN